MAVIPAYPSDVRNCNRSPATLPAGDALNAGQVERVMSADRVTIRVLNRCLDRADAWADGVTAIVDGFRTGERI